jgi:hypothetical protein
MIFPVPYFGIGVKLAVNDKTYRFSFIRNFVEEQYIGWTSTSDPGGGTSFGPTWLITREDAKPAKAAVQKWRAALEQPTNGGR